MQKIKQKCEKSNRKLFTPGKWEGVFYVLLLFFDKEQLSRWETTHGNTKGRENLSKTSA